MPESEKIFHMLGDGPLYQAFAEKAAAGVIDFRIVGCHGQSFLAVLVYLMTGSRQAVCWTSILLLLFSIILAGLIFYKLTGSRRLSAALPFGLVLMPSLRWEIFSGGTAMGILFVSLLFVYLCITKNRISLLVYFLSWLFRPYCAALLPLALIPFREQKSSPLFYAYGLAGAAIVIACYAASFVQTGTIINAYAPSFGQERTVAASLGFDIDTVSENVRHLFLVRSTWSTAFHRLARPVVGLAVMVLGMIGLWQLPRRGLFFAALALNFSLYLVTKMALIKYLFPAYAILFIGCGVFLSTLTLKKQQSPA